MKTVNRIAGSALKLLIPLTIVLMIAGSWLSNQHPAAAATAAPNTNAVYGPFPKLALALTTTPVVVKAAPGSLAWVACANGNAGTVFIQAFNTTGSITLGTTTPTFIIPVQAGVAMLPIPVSFGTGLKVAATTTASGMTAPGASINCTFGFN